MPSFAEALPVLNGIVGGVALAGVLYLILTNRLALPREVSTWRELYTEEKAARIKLEGTVSQMTESAAKQSDSHLDTIEVLKQFIPREKVAP